ncbi:hypothetical protein SRABI83_03978 [Arthrobacter sp. Bi83]|nr:hypothetical protein SRABI83_03978 [Arthrobacter sp. Bi83]
MGTHPEVCRFRLGVDSRQHVNPELHVAALQCPDLRLVLVGKVAEVPVLDTDHIGVAQREVHMELH